MLVSTKSASLFSTGSTSHSTIWVWARTTASGISPALASTATLWWRQARRPEAISTQSAGGDSTGSTTLASVRICCWILTLFINVAHSSITTWSSEVWWWSWCSSLYVPEGSFVLKFKICYYKTTFIFNFIFTIWIKYHFSYLQNLLLPINKIKQFLSITNTCDKVFSAVTPKLWEEQKTTSDFPSHSDGVNIYSDLTQDRRARLRRNSCCCIFEFVSAIWQVHQSPPLHLPLSSLPFLMLLYGNMTIFTWVYLTLGYKICCTSWLGL